MNNIAETSSSVRRKNLSFAVFASISSPDQSSIRHDPFKYRWYWRKGSSIVSRHRHVRTFAQGNYWPTLNCLLAVLTSFVNLRVTFSRSAAISMSMANISGHLMSTMNPAHLSDGVGGYFVTGTNFLAKANPKTNMSALGDKRNRRRLCILRFDRWEVLLTYSRSMPSLRVRYLRVVSDTKT